MERDATEAVRQLAQAMSDPVRIRIAAVLIDKELTIEQIASELGLRPAEIARHLKMLSSTGIVTETPDQNLAHYRVDLDALNRISRAAFASPRPSSPEMDGDEWEHKVLRDFIKDDRITSIPASHKKKLVILRWLMTRIPPDGRFSEREISALLKHYHPDFATLRRELVDNGFMTREQGVYWRSDTESERESSSS
ncbi:MAG: DUF2087 domain-containing protein [Nitrolancea sp.]